MRRLISGSLSRRDRLPIGVNVESSMRFWYLHDWKIRPFHPSPFCERKCFVGALTRTRRGKMNVKLGRNEKCRGH